MTDTLATELDEPGSFYEIRRCRAHPGHRDELVQLMDELVLPFMTEQGMQVTAGNSTSRCHL